jgi:hypothetical protein
MGLDWQFAGVAPVRGPGESDLVLRNVNTGQFEVYDVAGNTLVGAANLGTVGQADRRVTQVRLPNSRKQWQALLVAMA